MLKTFSISQLVFLALVGALMFVFDMLIISGIDTATGIPGAGFVVDTVFIVALAVIAGLAVPKFGTFVIIATIYAVLAIPTPLSGPPGVYKVGIGFILGLLADVVVWLFNYRRVGYYFSLAVANALVFPVLLFALELLELPGVGELRSAFWVLLVIIVIESFVGSWLGILLFDRKVKKMKVMRRIINV